MGKWFESLGTNNLVAELVDDCLEDCEHKQPPIHSGHEFYGVLLEEVQEAQEMLDTLKVELDSTWEDIKAGKSDLGRLQKMINYSRALIKEATQVTAVLYKYKHKILTREVDRFYKGE